MFEVLPGRFNKISLWGHTSTIKIAYIMTKLYSFLLFWLVFFFFEFSGFSDPRYLGVAVAVQLDFVPKCGQNYLARTSVTSLIIA